MSDDKPMYPVPDNEVERLAALRTYEILDSQPEADFDALTRVAAQFFQTPVAAIGLMDSNRFWLKSCLGLDVPELDREVAFCAYSVMQPGKLFIVEDLLKDARFKDNPMVAGPPYARFYAGAPIVDPNGYALGAVALVDIKPRTLTEDEKSVLADISKLVMNALKNHRRTMLLAKMALTDYLTGVANRAQFDRILESEMAHAKRTGEKFSVMCMDLDGFKEINDHFGHPAGDEVLCEVANRLRQQMRSEDSVARIGGDEFGIIIRESSAESGEMLARRIRQTMSMPITLTTGDEVMVGISIGMATYNSSINSPYTLLAQADSNLYQAKRDTGTYR